MRSRVQRTSACIYVLRLRAVGGYEETQYRGAEREAGTNGARTAQYAKAIYNLLEFEEIKPWRGVEDL